MERQYSYTLGKRRSGKSIRAVFAITSSSSLRTTRYVVMVFMFKKKTNILWSVSLSTFYQLFLQCHNEAYKISLNEFDVFLGSKTDPKNPVPTRYALSSLACLETGLTRLIHAGTVSGSRPQKGRSTAGTSALTIRTTC